MNLVYEMEMKRNRPVKRQAYAVPLCEMDAPGGHKTVRRNGNLADASQTDGGYAIGRKRSADVCTNRCMRAWEKKNRLNEYGTDREQEKNFGDFVVGDVLVGR